jgi:hypothetical protein
MVGTGGSVGSGGKLGSGGSVTPDARPDATPQAPEARPDSYLSDLPPWLACYVRENVGCAAGQGCYLQYEAVPVVGNVLKAKCHPAGAGVMGSTCNSNGNLECAPGHLCWHGTGTGGGAGCFPSCFVGWSNCPSGMFCLALPKNMQEAAGELDLGVCQ